MIEVARPRTHARGNYVARLHHTDGRREVLLLPAGFSPRRVTDDLLRFAGHGDFRFGQTVDSQTLRGRNRKKTSRLRPESETRESERRALCRFRPPSERNNTQKSIMHLLRRTMYT